MNPALSDVDALLREVRVLHERIRRGVAGCLERAARDGRDHASRPGGWGAGDITYALDEVADAPLADFLREVGRLRPVTLIAEGPGESSAAPDRPRLAHGVQLADGTRLADGARRVDTGLGRSAPGPSDPARPGTPGAEPDGHAVRVLVDPIDGTRPLMHDMRPAWICTGVAPDRGPHTRLSHIELAVQSELPVSGAATFQVLVARRGRGALRAVHDVVSGERLAEQSLVADGDVPFDNGFFGFNRFLPVERPLAADLERRFLERAVPDLGLDPRLLYDDQYLCSSGQVVLAATGRYRLLADLRAWLGRVHGLATTAVKPYDMAAVLVATEAGVPVLDAAGRPLDAPLDTETDLDVVAYGNADLQRAFAPHLEAAMEAHARAARASG